MVAFTGLWTFWSFGEMYHEGWFGDWTNRLPYLIPSAACFLLTIAAIRWPRPGGTLLILVGVAFTVFFMDVRIESGRLTVGRGLGGLLVSLPPVLVGLLFRYEARSRRARREAGIPRSRRWWIRNLAYLAAVAVPVAIAFAVSAVNLPIVLTRLDDGDRGTRRIRGNGVDLLWAPEGPGWNWRQEYGGYPSWQALALWGLEPVGFGDKPGYDWWRGRYARQEEMNRYDLCRYLGEDGRTLTDALQNIWRMPTVDELVRSLGRHGQNSGCTWKGPEPGRSACEVRPDKETPLWAPDRPPVYYWAFEEYGRRDAYFVAYNGRVGTAHKVGGNPRHTHRCVREPPPR